MAIPVIMPRQGQSVESCIITKWYKKPGDKVAAGDMLFSYETDKAAFDEEAKADGTLLEIFYNEGDDVPVLVNVCVIGSPGEDASGFRPDGAAITEGTKPIIAAEAVVDAEMVASAVTVTPAGTVDPAGAIAPAGTSTQAKTAASVNEAAPATASIPAGISPRARNKAERLGVDIRKAEPSGPSGRIIDRDIDTAASKGMFVTRSAAPYAAGTAVAGKADMEAAMNIAGTGIGGRLTVDDIRGAASHLAEKGQTVKSLPDIGAAEFTEVKLTNIRKVIAKAMFNSLASTAQLTVNSSFDATDIMEFRKKIKEALDKSKEAQVKSSVSNITLNDVILYAVSRTLGAYRDLNAHFLDDRMVKFNNVNLALAVDTDRGLMVPVIFKADTKSLSQISAEAKELIESCQKGTINPDLLRGGSFTVTNMGTLGIESFTPVLNAPQTGILGVNNIIQRARENGDGTYSFYPAMGLSLTFDHRAIDGAPAAKFLRDLGRFLENFTVMLAT